MTRSVEEWVGKTDDAKIPARVYARVFERHEGCCYLCKRKLLLRREWELDHIVALANGGAHAETNLAPACTGCHSVKSKADVAEKSKVAQVRKKHLGLKKPKNPMPGSKASPWRRRMDGTVERR